MKIQKMSFLLSKCQWSFQITKLIGTSAYMRTKSSYV